MRRERASGALLFGGIGLVAVSTSIWSLTDWQPGRYPEGLSMFFPAVILGLAAIVSAVLVVDSDAQDPAVSTDTPAAPQRGRRLLAVIAVLTLYLAAMPVAGFPLATAAFQSIVLRVPFGRRGPAWLLILPLAATTSIVLLFSRLLTIPLPRGVGWFYSFNTLLM